jgi:hypothetical protein
MTGTVVVRGASGAPRSDTLGSTTEGPDTTAVTLAALGMLLLASAAVADWIYRGRAARRYRR